SYVKISANLFGCAGVRDRGTCDNRLNIRTEALENTILDLLKTRLMEPQLFKAFCEEFHREVSRHCRAWSDPFALARAPISEVKAALLGEKETARKPLSIGDADRTATGCENAPNLNPARCTDQQSEPARLS